MPASSTRSPSAGRQAIEAERTSESSMSSSSIGMPYLMSAAKNRPIPPVAGAARRYASGHEDSARRRRRRRPGARDASAPAAPGTPSERREPPRRREADASASTPTDEPTPTADPEPEPVALTCENRCSARRSPTFTTGGHRRSPPGDYVGQAARPRATRSRVLRRRRRVLPSSAPGTEAYEHLRLGAVQRCRLGPIRAAQFSPRAGRRRSTDAGFS